MRAACFAVTATLLSLGIAAHAADRGEMQAKDTFRDAALAPLEDLNLKQKGIPAVLNRARSDPYDLQGLSRCEPIAAEIGRLDAALGPDLDEPPAPDSRSRVQKVGGAIKDAGISELRSESASLLPFRSWVRKLTGAARHDKKVQAAIRAGEVRRGYLKGVGMRMNCAPPAAPSWFVPEPPRPPLETAVGVSLDGLWVRIVTWFWSWWPL